MYDLVIANGTVLVDGHGLIACDVAMQDGKITALLASGQAKATATADTIEAGGLLVLPGVIDAHVHFGLGSADDYRTESAAAARGGVTTVLNYVMSAESYLEAGARDRNQAERDSVIDFGLHFVLMNERHLEEIDAYIDKLGVTSFKYFMNFRGNEGSYLGVEGTDLGFFYALCMALGRHPGAVLAVHAENIEIVWRLASRVRESGRDDLAAWDESRPAFVEALDIAVALMMAEHADCNVYIPHLSSARGLAALRNTRSRSKVWVETCPHYLTHTKESELGTLVKVNPPVRTEEDVDALWRGIHDGIIQVAGSDHNSRVRAKKEGAIWNASAGFPGVTTLLPVMLTVGHVERGLSIPRLMEMMGRSPASIFGLYPSKGYIGVGADADVILVDLKRNREVDAVRFGSHADYSIYDGWHLRGWPVATIVRGTVVMMDDEILVEPGFGQFIRRPATSPSRRARDGA